MDCKVKMLLYTTFILFITLISNSNVKSQGLSNSEIWADLPIITVDKVLDVLLDKMYEIEEQTFLVIMQAKVIVDMIKNGKKCDCNNLQYIDNLLTEYFNYNGENSNSESTDVLENAGQEQTLDEPEENQINS